jgi:hypothetical protein
MPNIRFNTQLHNKGPIGPGESQPWFSTGLGEDEVIVITAVAASLGPGMKQSDTLAVEKVRVETTLDELSDPSRRVHYSVKNVGASTIEHYVINVAILSP